MTHSRLDCAVPPDTGRPGDVFTCSCGRTWTEQARTRTSTWGALMGNEREVDGSRGRWLRKGPKR